MGLFNRKKKRPAMPIPSQEHVDKVLRQVQERLASSDLCPRCAVNLAAYAPEEFNGTTYCYLCAAEYKSMLELQDGLAAEKESGRLLLDEVVLCKRPLSSCMGEVQPTDFIFFRFPHQVLIKWGVGWRGGYSHADGAGGTETLPGDFFQNNTMDDLIAYLESRSWAEDFLQWFDVRNNEKLNAIFADPLSGDQREGLLRLVHSLTTQITPDRKAITLFLVDRGDASRYHEMITLQRQEGAWSLLEDYLTPEFAYQKTFSLPDVTDHNITEWLTGFITDHPKEILQQHACPASGLYHGEQYRTE